MWHDLAMKPSLELLFGPQAIPQFFEAYQTNTPLLISCADEVLSGLTQSPLLASIDSLLKAWPSGIEVYLDGIADEVNSTKVESAEARQRFMAGRSLLFNDANVHSPLIQAWTEAIKRDLRISNMTYARGLIYATPAGHGTDPHFDQNINFVLQVHGTKKWWITKNQYVHAPLSRYTIGRPPDPELTTYLEAPLPETFPDHAAEYTLGPGSLLFLPRGAWHRTEAVTDALSLNLTYSAPTWLDLFTAALRARLALSEDWRETANSVADFTNSPEVVDHFDALITGFLRDAPNWRAVDILDATERVNTQS